MIIGLGIDLVELARIRRSWERFGLRFAEKILHPVELSMLPRNPVEFLASRFAAKEAAVKALGTGFAAGITVRDVYVASLVSGAPQICFSNGAQERISLLGVTRSHLSLTHARDTAAAVVILEG